MQQLCVKGHGDKIELCFGAEQDFSQALEGLREMDSFFRDTDIKISYSGIELSYNEEMRLSKELAKLFGKGAILEKKHRLSKEQINYSLDEDEEICLVINKSLRSGETVTGRGDVIIYGDVNPGACVKAQGNITVLGALRGVAHILGKGRVYSTYMQPSQIRIGKVCSYNKTEENVGCAVALEENGEIILQCL